jgi:integrase
MKSLDKIPKLDIEAVGLHKQLQNIIDLHVTDRCRTHQVWNAAGDRRVRSKKAIRGSGLTSNRTREIRAELIHLSFRELHDLGFEIRRAENLSDKHVQALVKKWHLDGLANITVTNKLSTLRIFSRWIGKPGLVRSTASYFPDNPTEHQVVRVATHDNSPEALGVDFDELLKAADLQDQRFGAMLRLCKFFGLRAREAIMFKPAYALSNFAHNREVILSRYSGAKGGRPRIIKAWPGDDAFAVQRRADQDDTVKIVRHLCGSKLALGWFDGDVGGLEASEKRLYNMAASFRLTKKGLGFTLHDLRKSYARDNMVQRNFIPPLIGGDLSEPKAVRDLAILSVMNDLGHNNAHTGGAYYGSLRPIKKTDLNPQ